MDRELRAHVELRAEELEREGWTPEDARREALRLFGDVDTVARACRRVTSSHERAVRRADMLGALWQDMRYGWRTLRRSPGFALVAVVTLALGLGANTAIFSVVNSVLFRPLPFEDPEALVWLRENRTDGGTMSVAWANFRDWREESASFSALAAYGTANMTVLGGDQPVRARLAVVSQDFPSVFRLRPLVGRLPVASDFEPGAPAVALTSRRFWQQELGGRALDGLQVEVNGSLVEVVGVLSDGFDYPAGTDLWANATLFGQSDSRTAHNWAVVGRLASGVTLDVARQEIDAMTRRLVATEPDADPDFLATGATVITLHEELVGDARAPLLLLLAAAGMVLLVACTNLASTLLARGMNRRTELAVRRSLGAGSGRLVRQLLTESLILAALGGLAGVALARGLLGALRVMDPAAVPRMGELSMDGSALAYAALMALATALVFGVMPARRLSRYEPGTALRSGARGNAADRRGMVWRLLVGTEVALAVVLLTGAGLLIRSFQRVLDEDAGFQAADVATASISLSLLKYDDPQDHALWYAGFLEEVAALPGVEGAGLISSLPVTGFFPNGRLELDGDPDKRAVGGYVVASGGAFAALDVPLLQGRVFDQRDGPDDVHVAVVSESFAREYWPGDNPIGKSVSGGGMDNFWKDRVFAEVVGVVGDVRYEGLESRPVPTVYFPLSQRPFRIQYGASVVVEASNGDPDALLAGIRATLQRLEPDVPLRVAPYPTLLQASVAPRRFTTTLLSGFSLLALLLAGVGIYGVVAYTVARRTREMGIRMALGADGHSVVRMMVSASLRMVTAGLVAGVVLSLGLSRVLSGLLYEVSPQDPATLVIVAALLWGVAFLASWVPARVGTRVDPMITMRAE